LEPPLLITLLKIKVLLNFGTPTSYYTFKNEGFLEPQLLITLLKIKVLLNLEPPLLISLLKMKVLWNPNFLLHLKMKVLWNFGTSTSY